MPTDNILNASVTLKLDGGFSIPFDDSSEAAYFLSHPIFADTHQLGTTGVLPLSRDSKIMGMRVTKYTNLQTASNSDSVVRAVVACQSLQSRFLCACALTSKCVRVSSELTPPSPNFHCLAAAVVAVLRWSARLAACERSQHRTHAADSFCMYFHENHSNAQLSARAAHLSQGRIQEFA